MLLLVRCTHCRQQMKYQSRGEAIGKNKTCVYCGRNFRINRETIDKLLER